MATPLASAFSSVFGSSPLRHPRFRYFYIASILVALGYTMQVTTAAWQMATMTPSPLMVALVQSASTAPTLLVGLVAGALADIIERRRIILVTQLVLIAATAALGATTLSGHLSPAGLLALTFLIGAGFTFYMPAQQASINDLVTRPEVPQAVALGAVAFNMARAVGPALAGAIAAWFSPGSALLASAACFLMMLVVVRRWKLQLPALPGVPETLFSGISSGVRFVRHSATMRAIIIRNLSFSASASALWALLPVIARDQLQLGAGGYGILFGSFGAGAVAGALSIPKLLRKNSLQKIVVGSALLWVIASSIIAATNHVAVAVVGACMAGASWVGVLASLSAGTQSAAPAWVRARAVAMNLLAVQASLAIGSVVWGIVASWTDTKVALIASAIAMLVMLFVNRNVRVRLGREADVTHEAHLPDLGIKVEPLPDDGPVLIQIEYRIDAANRPAFLAGIRKVEPTRRRNGASSWRVFRDLSEDGRFVERYIIDSWAEYVRLRRRMTMTDRQIQEEVMQLQRADTPIRVSRLLGVDLAEANLVVPVDTSLVVQRR